MQTAEWDEPESDLDEDDILDLQASENADENKGSWAGTLLKTNLGGFLHGLTGTKVTPEVPRTTWNVLVGGGGLRVRVRRMKKHSVTKMEHCTQGAIKSVSRCTQKCLRTGPK